VVAPLLPDLIFSITIARGLYQHPSSSDLLLLQTIMGIRLLALFLLLGFAFLVSAQSPTPSYSFSTGTTTVISTITSNRQNLTITTTLPTTYSVLVTPTPTPSPQPIVLDTVIDPGFGVLGAILILSGIPGAFLGHKNRWYVHLVFLGDSTLSES
jgi:hypothetical protein